MTQQEHKYFADTNGKLNSDDAPFAVGTNEWVNAENIRTGTTDAGETGTVESVGSNVLLSQPQPSVVFITIGSVEDSPNNRFIKFQYNSTGTDHKIVALYNDTNTEYDVLLSSQVGGGLNFSKDHPIHSPVIFNSLLYWTDNYNQPKKINVDKALMANNPSLNLGVTPYSLPMVYPTQTLIKRPPYYPLQVTKKTDAGFPNNFINDNAYQMQYYYGFIDGEISKLSAYSQLVPYGSTTPSTDNYVQISIPFSEQIDDDVQQIFICIRYVVDGSIGWVKIWDKSTAADATAIENHNNGVTQLSYNFYDNTNVSFLDATYASTPFDSVPLLSEGLSGAVNRLFLSNNLQGYNTPAKTSLAVTIGTTDTGGATSYSGSWKYTTLYYYDSSDPSKTLHPINIYYFYTSLLPSQTSWLFLAYIHTTGGWPSPIDSSTADTYWNTESNLAYYVIRNNIGLSSGQIYVYSPAPTFTVAGSGTLDVTIPSTGLQFFKSNSTYNVSIEFLDRFRQKTGVIRQFVTNTIPVRTYNQTIFSSSLNWTLSNDDALDEIPEEAYYYQIMVTKNLSEQSFVQIYGIKNKYVVKNADGTYTYDATTWSTNTYYAVAFDLTQLTAAGLGYIYTPGDILYLYKSDGTYIRLPVLGQDGSYVLASPTDIGDLTSGTVLNLIEIFTPYTASASEPYYETGGVFPVLNAGTSGRLYSTTSGSLNGDTYALKRNNGSGDYWVEAMSPNDRFWKNWFRDIGWINYITTLGQKRHQYQITFSETFIQDSQVNGLSTFDSANIKDVPVNCGIIRKLVLTSKVAGEQGSVMLAICETRVVSIYLGETRLLDNTGATQFVASSTDVIGTMNVLKGTFGTKNPESVVEFRGDVFFLDIDNGRWIQYSINGLDIISIYKMDRFWNLWCKKFRQTSSTTIESFGCRPFVFTTVDPYHLELLISIPQLSSEPYNGYLPDYPNVVYPFDILDYQAKTIVYKLGRASVLPHWQGAYTFYAENFVSLQNNLYSFKNGLTYLHNQTTSFCNFYGVQYKSKIGFVSNLLPTIPKIYNNIGIEANMQPTFVYLYNNYPYQQSSDLVDFDFRNYEGIFYATFYRNKLIPNAFGYSTDGLLTGEKMRGVIMFIWIEFSVNNIPLELKFVNIGVENSQGHTNQIK